jgi:hypothetical protein
MNLVPQKLFIGLMDFFSILLPGALLTYLLMDEAGTVVLGDSYGKLAGAEAWAAFLFASYLFGYLVFLFGSWLDELYDWARPYTLNTQSDLLARCGHLMPWIWLVFIGETQTRSGSYGHHQDFPVAQPLRTFQVSAALARTAQPGLAMSTVSGNPGPLVK